MSEPRSVQLTDDLDEESEAHPGYSPHWLVGFVAVAWTVFQFYIELQPGAVQPHTARLVHLTAAICVYLIVDITWARQKHKTRRAVVSGLVLVAWLVVALLTYGRLTRLSTYFGAFTETDVLVALVGIALIAELTRRRMGWTLPLIGAVFILYGAYGSSLPGILELPTLGWELVVNGAYYSGEGVFGTILGAAVTYIFLFVIFGSLLLQYGFGDYLTSLSRLIFGNSVGAAGKMSMLASMLFGSVSDSTTANVSTTGSVTIPYMKRSGISSTRAAGIEAAGSVGGQISPPVMGSTAFVMAALTGIPYATIISAALVPALLFYGGLFVVVHGDAARLGVGTLGRPGAGEARRLLRDGWRYALPMATLVYLLVGMGLVASTAAAWSVLVLIACNVWGQSVRRSLSDLYYAIIRGCRNMVVVSLATAIVGTIVSPVLQSGIGLKLGSALVDLSGGSLFLLLLIGMVGMILMGSGMPTTATYIIMSILIVPPLIDLGASALAAHMFVLYYSVLADISPPTMATVYVASGLAGSKPIPSALHTIRIASCGFLIPFIWMYSPALLLPESPGGLDFAMAVASAVGATLTLSIVLSRYHLGRLGWASLLIVGVAGACFVAPQEWSDVGGVLLLGGVTVVQLLRRRRAPSASHGDEQEVVMVRDVAGGDP